MIRNDIRDLTDDELAKLVEPFYKHMETYIKENYLQDFFAYYISKAYNDNLLWKQTYNQLTFTIIEIFSQLSMKDCNIDKINKILKEKYKLEITETNPINIKEIK